MGSTKEVALIQLLYLGRSELQQKLPSHLTRDTRPWRLQLQRDPRLETPPRDTRMKKGVGNTPVMEPSGSSKQQAWLDHISH